MSERKVVGVDVGGAHLKYCSTDQQALSEPFAMWRHPGELADALMRGLAEYSDCHAIAVTMTGELADCFIDRQAGVGHIVDHTLSAASDLGYRDVAFYGVDGRFRQAASAKQHADSIAAGNWHALANFVAKTLTSDAVLIDVGSTTTDLIPLAGGRVETSARSDFDRLLEGSLVYVGCSRTPVCAIVESLEYRGRVCPVMNEVFATIDDARLLLGGETEDPTDCDSADGKPRTQTHAANRIARMIGLDRRAVSVEDAISLARQVVNAAKQRIAAKVPDSDCYVVSGHGEDLLSLSSSASIVRLADQFGALAARCAPSFAVAKLFQADSNEAQS